MITKYSQFNKEKLLSITIDNDNFYFLYHIIIYSSFNFSLVRSLLNNISGLYGSLYGSRLIPYVFCHSRLKIGSEDRSSPHDNYIQLYVLKMQPYFFSIQVGFS